MHVAQGFASGLDLGWRNRVQFAVYRGALVGGLSVEIGGGRSGARPMDGCVRCDNVMMLLVRSFLLCVSGCLEPGGCTGVWG